MRMCSVKYAITNTMHCFFRQSYKQKRPRQVFQQRGPTMIKPRPESQVNFERRAKHETDVPGSADKRGPRASLATTALSSRQFALRAEALPHPTESDTNIQSAGYWIYRQKKHSDTTYNKIVFYLGSLRRFRSFVQLIIIISVARVNTPAVKARDDGLLVGGMERLRNDMQTVPAEGRLHVGYIQSHTRQGEEHIQENHGLYRVRGKLRKKIDVFR